MAATPAPTNTNVPGATPPQPPPGSASAQDNSAEPHEHDIQHREAYEYWGYMFQADKTGTDKLKGLLRGLKELINEHYEPSDNQDLTPTQLASFYRELHGNYDQLFLGTPSESIAFIYKSLGCLHSLQPLSHSTAFTDPTVPALKTEGWIMWQTIQLLLGPDEHSSFLTEAVQKWDVKDPATGEAYPKILPRQCFPMEPDKHMVAWYEGVSERLRREAEDEERQRDIEAQQAEVRRIHDRKREDDDDEDSVDSRGAALAYFRNPLYRHVDGRPSIVRRSSKRPTLSPRPTMMHKGKEAASTMGHVIRNIGSPHLWDGRHHGKSHSRDPRDRRRRSSLPDNRYPHPDDMPSSAGYDSKHSPGYDRNNRRRSTQLDRPPSGSTADDQYSPEPTLAHPSHHQRHASHNEDRDATLRHSRSHEPTPSQKEYPDYFHGYDDPSRRSSTHNSNNTPGSPPVPTPNGIGPALGPSASPLFASHVAQQPQPQPPQLPRSVPPENYPPPRGNPSMRRAQERPYSRSPDPFAHMRDRDDRRDSRRFSSRDGRPRSQGPGSYDDRPSEHGRRGSGTPGGYSRDRRSHHMSGSDLSGPDDSRDRREREREDEGRRSRQPHKQTRFAAGVDGRRYPSEGPWR